MIKRIPVIFIILVCTLSLYAQQRAIVAGMKIEKTTKIRKGIYKIDAPVDTSQSLITIEGDNITVDFNHSDLRGSNKQKQPNEFFGIAVIVRNGKNITIKNLKARGFKVALLAKNVDKLKLENCDFSYNYRPRLNSSPEREDMSDWMSYHRNENDEWLRYGAAIYLRNCEGAQITNCRVTGGQNALMMRECNGGRINNNDFSFNSGIGIGMYRCNGNQICYNRINFNVRGYSHGVYSRGQDSAGILVYEQSNQNIFYKNSVTHGGDGLFLWAGQTTMETGNGGCNDNIILQNDFSFAPANGVEATFSRNWISGNRIFECDHGVWGGYCFASKITSNQFRNNRIGIAIEHGQHNEISYNIFSGNKEAIKLWAKTDQPDNLGYSKFRNTRSLNYTIAMNNFVGNPVALTARKTDSLMIFGNVHSNNEVFLQIDSTVSNIDSTVRELTDETLIYPVVKDPADPFKGNGKFAGRRNIRMTEWGPYDFRSPIIWHTNPTDAGDTLKFDLIGPKGKWKVRSFKGVKNISFMRGEFPASITAQKQPGERTDIYIELEYIGSAVTSPFGHPVGAGRPYKFSFKKFFQPIDWQVEWFAFDSSSNPVQRPEQLHQLNKFPPIRQASVDRLEYAWWGGIRKDEKQYRQFLTLATGQAFIADGQYELSVTWDDAIRVYVDDKLIIDEWNPAVYPFDEAPHRNVRVKLGGIHRFKIEHAETGGFASLYFRLNKM